MTSQVKGLVLFCLHNISVVGSKVPSSLKTTIQDTSDTTKSKSTRKTSLVKLLRNLHSLAYSCVWHLQLFNRGKQTFIGCMKDFPGFFSIQVSTEAFSAFKSQPNIDHTYNSSKIRKIFQLQNGTVNQ